jgi:hypothetical protein
MNLFLLVVKLFAALLEIAKAAIFYRAGKQSAEHKAEREAFEYAMDIARELEHEKNLNDRLGGDDIERLRQLLNARDTADR